MLKVTGYAAYHLPFVGNVYGAGDFSNSAADRNSFGNIGYLYLMSFGNAIDPDAAFPDDDADGFPPFSEPHFTYLPISKL